MIEEVDAIIDTSGGMVSAEIHGYVSCGRTQSSISVRSGIIVLFLPHVS